MSLINAKELGIYAPKSNEAAALSREADKVLNQAIYEYKQLFYGLRTIAWKNRDKSATFYEALAAGELDQFKVAPGHRATDGSYTKSEWDIDRLNAYLWNRFRERFDAAFNLDNIQGLNKLKDIAQATRELLEVALSNWGTVLLGELETDEESLSIGTGVSHLDVQHDGIRITGMFDAGSQKIQISSTSIGLPTVDVFRCDIDGTWHTTMGSSQAGGARTSLNITSAKLYARMLELAAHIAEDMEGFMANPEGFLGLESKQAHARNLQLIKSQLLQINKDQMEKRKASRPETEMRQLSREIAAEELETNIDATSQSAADYGMAEAAKILNSSKSNHEQLAGPLKVYKVDPATLTQTKKPQTLTQRKRQRELEAQRWLEQNGEALKDIDVELGLTTVDAAKLKAAAEAELPM